MEKQYNFSNNFLNDLSISLENASKTFINVICQGLKWRERTLKKKMEVEILHGIDIYDIITKPKIMFALRIYNDLIGTQQFANRSLNWKIRLRGYYKELHEPVLPPIHYSNNILKDLVTSLESVPLLFRDNVCSVLNWSPTEFEIKRLAPVAKDYDIYNTFNKKQIGHIIPIYRECIVEDQIRNRHIYWKDKISNS
jgi:hypothetical protein